jgi:hypothetical protein
MYTPDCFNNPECANITAEQFRRYLEGPFEDWELYRVENKITIDDALLLYAKFYGNEALNAMIYRQLIKQEKDHADT